MGSVDSVKSGNSEKERKAADKNSSKKRLAFDILKMTGVFAALLAFFSGLFYAFEMELWIAVPFALLFEVIALILFVIKRKKPSFPLKQISGILIIIVGLGVVVIPFVAQNITDKRQKEMIQDIEDYFAGMEKKEASTESNSQAATTPTAVAEETTTNVAMQKDKEVVNNLKKQNIYGIIEIPSLEVKYAIVQGTETTNLRSAVGHMTEGVDAGQEGNCIIAGHRGGYYGKFFQDIDKLENGAEILVTDLENNTYTYTVYEQKWIKPYDWYELNGIPGEKMLTLLSCEEEGELRIIVRARIVE